MKSRRIPTKKPLYLDGPRRGIKEIWFALKVGYSFLYNNYKLHNIGPGITVFGSARIPENSFYYKAATEFGRRIALMNFTTITGGGPGIMEAANKGAYEAGGRSVGMNIVLPHEQHENPYVTTSVIFEYFFTRKVMLVKHSYAFIVMPGGFGTMDEFFEILTLIQTKSTDRYPVILFGVEYYKVLIEMMNIMAQNGTIAEEDIRLLLVTDSIDDAMEHIQKFIKDNFAVYPHRPRWRWLEKK